MFRLNNAYINIVIVQYFFFNSLVICAPTTSQETQTNGFETDVVTDKLDEGITSKPFETEVLNLTKTTETLKTPVKPINTSVKVTNENATEANTTIHTELGKTPVELEGRSLPLPSTNPSISSTNLNPTGTRLSSQTSSQPILKPLGPLPKSPTTNTNETPSETTQPTIRPSTSQIGPRKMSQPLPTTKTTKSDTIDLQTTSLITETEPSSDETRIVRSTQFTPTSTTTNLKSTNKNTTTKPETTQAPPTKKVKNSDSPIKTTTTTTTTTTSTEAPRDSEENDSADDLLTTRNLPISNVYTHPNKKQVTPPNKLKSQAAVRLQSAEYPSSKDAGKTESESYEENEPEKQLHPIIAGRKHNSKRKRPHKKKVISEEVYEDPDEERDEDEDDDNYEENDDDDDYEEEPQKKVKLQPKKRTHKKRGSKTIRLPKRTKHKKKIPQSDEDDLSIEPVKKKKKEKFDFETEEEMDEDGNDYEEEEEDEGEIEEEQEEKKKPKSRKKSRKKSKNGDLSSRTLLKHMKAISVQETSELKPTRNCDGMAALQCQQNCAMTIQNCLQMIQRQCCNCMSCLNQTANKSQGHTLKTTKIHKEVLQGIGVTNGPQQNHDNLQENGNNKPHIEDVDEQKLLWSNFIPGTQGSILILPTMRPPIQLPTTNSFIRNFREKSTHTHAYIPNQHYYLPPKPVLGYRPFINSNHLENLGPYPMPKYLPDVQPLPTWNRSDIFVPLPRPTNVQPTPPRDFNNTKILPPLYINNTHILPWWFNRTIVKQISTEIQPSPSSGIQPLLPNGIQPSQPFGNEHHHNRTRFLEGLLPSSIHHPKIITSNYHNQHESHLIHPSSAPVTDCFPLCKPMHIFVYHVFPNTSSNMATINDYQNTDCYKMYVNKLKQTRGTDVVHNVPLIDIIYQEPLLYLNDVIYGTRDNYNTNMLHNIKHAHINIRDSTSNMMKILNYNHLNGNQPTGNMVYNCMLVYPLTELSGYPIQNSYGGLPMANTTHTLNYRPYLNNRALKFN